ncbi:MazG family protein [Lolliginicoccus lacisalsi]|uniref:MazG family protein n=1 Tax=Lolliginicoccus lacisalsi TaxID=2742202 RepID=UPI001CDCA81C|nr:MazG family protein [Lolliginicoccus lacisalsi]
MTTTVLLDPQRPSLVPAAALPHLTLPTYLADDLVGEVREQLAVIATPALNAEHATTLVTTDPHHPGRERHPATITLGDPPFPGHQVLTAIDIMDTMRAHGPWEKQQTHHSLLRYLLEETYELLDAAHGTDRDELRSELGDLLLQVLFHARIAHDDPTDPFPIDDIARALTTKLLHRNPLEHLQPGSTLDVDEQDRRWQQRKATEKPRASLLDGIPRALPGLALAEKILERAHTAGMPADLVPAGLRTVTLVPGGDTEIVLRRSISTLVRAIESIEKSLGRPPREPDEWRAHWPGVASC